MAGEARWTPQAREDLLDIYVAIGLANEAAAERWFDRIHHIVGLLAHTPLLGTARDDLLPGLRSFPIGHHLVFFAPVEGGLEVIRVIDGRRNYSGMLSAT